MNARSRTLVTLLGALAVSGAVLVRRHARGAMGKEVPGGILIGDAALYDALSHRFLLGPLFERIAADIAAVAPSGARLLEVGCFEHSGDHRTSGRARVAGRSPARRSRAWSDPFPPPSGRGQAPRGSQRWPPRPGK